MLAVASELVSVVIPTQNRCARLQRAMASVQKQTASNLEIVVVDDASSDGTKSVVEQLALADRRIRYIRNDTPCGGAGARNVGISASRGRFVAFLDDDDEWLPTKVESQLAEIVAQPTVAGVSCSIIIVDASGRKRSKLLQVPSDRQQLLQANVLGGASVCMASREILNAVGGFDIGLRSGQDWDLWLKLHACGDIRVCREPLVLYTLHGDGQITDNTAAAYSGRRRIFMRYRNQMSPRTRRNALCELCFFRWVLFRQNWRGRLSGLVALVRFAQGINKFRFPYRLARRALWPRLVGSPG